MHRLARLRRNMAEREIDAVLIVAPDNQFYLSGFKAVIYSRPILLLVNREHTSIIVPGLERDHAEGEKAADEILVYYEHPEMANHGTSHLEHLDRLLGYYASGATVGIEFDSCPVSLADYLHEKDFRVSDIGTTLTEVRYVKDEAEIQRVEEAGRLVNLAVSKSLAMCEPGVTELDIDAAGTAALFEEAARNRPNATLEAMAFSPSGPDRSAWPHVFSNTRRLEEGDVAIHSRQVSLNGYRAELERTMILGEPTQQQREAFGVACEAQQAAMDAIEPGVTAASVDYAAREIIQNAGYGEYAIHRTGHGLGISAHEEPHLRFDNDLVLEEGMVFTVEPGFYVPGFGGFRHSDTLVVEKNGSRLVTEYPRDLESLTLC